MLPASYTFKIERGSNAPITIRIKSRDNAGVVSVTDLTGYLAELDINWPGGSIQKNSADGGLSLDLPSGAITWTPLESETLSLPSGALAKYTYWLTAPDGTREPYLRGLVIGDD